MHLKQRQTSALIQAAVHIPNTKSVNGQEPEPI